MLPVAGEEKGGRDGDGVVALLTQLPLGASEVRKRGLLQAEAPAQHSLPRRASGRRRRALGDESGGRRRRRRGGAL